MKIILAKKEDLNKIINIEYEANKIRYNYKSKEQVKNILNEFFDKSTFFILINKEEICGYISLIKKGSIGEIEFIAIKKKYQGKGMGSILINFSEKYFKRLKCNKIRLEVMHKNTNAINFYNFHKFNIIKTYKKGKNIKIVMQKEI